MNEFLEHILGVAVNALVPKSIQEHLWVRKIGHFTLMVTSIIVAGLLLAAIYVTVRYS